MLDIIVSEYPVVDPVIMMVSPRTSVPAVILYPLLDSGVRSYPLVSLSVVMVIARGVISNVPST